MINVGYVGDRVRSIVRSCIVCWAMSCHQNVLCEPALTQTDVADWPLLYRLPAARQLHPECDRTTYIGAIITRLLKRVQTSADAKIRDKSDPDSDVCRICPEMLWMHYLVGVSHFTTVQISQ